MAEKQEWGGELSLSVLGRGVRGSWLYPHPAPRPSNRDGDCCPRVRGICTQALLALRWKHRKLFPCHFTVNSAFPLVAGGCVGVSTCVGLRPRLLCLALHPVGHTPPRFLLPTRPGALLPMGRPRERLPSAPGHVLTSPLCFLRSAAKGRKISTSSSHAGSRS